MMDLLCRCPVSPDETVEIYVNKWPISDAGLLAMAKLMDFYAENWREVVADRAEEERKRKARLIWARQFTPPSKW